MSRWFRHYAGMARDDKLVRASIKSGQTVERVLWVWSAILESAAEIDDDGRYEVEKAEIARFLRCPASKIAAIESALFELGRVAEGKVSNWASRQFKSDRSAERTKAYRDRNRDGDVTSPKRHGDAPETETDTERKKVTADAVSPYAFEGAVIRLKRSDLERWRKAYPDIEVEAQLQSRDDWLANEADEATRKKWFVSTSNHLANLQSKAGQIRREVEAYESPC